MGCITSTMIRELKQFLQRKAIDLIVPAGFYLRMDGHCPCCDQEVFFESNNSWLRENLVCTFCHSIPRERALLLTLQRHFPDWKNLMIHESSPGNHGASLKLKNQCRTYNATQYYPGERSGKMVNQVRNEDLENQSFPDCYFDIVVTQDVMEHVYDPRKAFAEIARTLKRGGAHIFTVPLNSENEPSAVWATKGEDGNPVFLHQPEYHGNPLDPKGSPVTMHWGYDIVDFIKQHSGLDTMIERMDEPEYGVIGNHNEVLVSYKILLT
jgi:hypothetical protein